MELNTLSGLIVFGVLAIPILVVTFLVTIIFFGNDGIEEMWKLHNEVRDMHKNIREEVKRL